MKNHWKLLLTIVVLAAIIGAFLWISLAPQANEAYNRMSVGALLTQLLLSLLTLATVCWSIWGEEIKNALSGPSVDIRAVFDDAHCIVAGNDQDETSPVAPSLRLRLYAHAVNESGTPGRECQVISSKVYVSVDGESYYSLRNVLPAAFKWVYSSQENAFVTDVRHSVDKYFRVLEIVQMNSSSDSDDEKCECPSPTSSTRSSNISWIEVCVPPADGCKAKLRIETRYKSVLVPITLVVRGQPDKTKYMRVTWSGESVFDYKKPGLLNVQMIEKTIADTMIKG